MQSKNSWKDKFQMLLLEKNLMLNGTMWLGFNKPKKFYKKLSSCPWNFLKFSLDRDNLGEASYSTVLQVQEKPTLQKHAQLNKKEVLSLVFLLLI